MSVDDLNMVTLSLYGGWTVVLDCVFVVKPSRLASVDCVALQLYASAVTQSKSSRLYSCL